MGRYGERMSDPLVLKRGTDVTDLPWRRLERAAVIVEAVLQKLDAYQRAGGLGFRVVVGGSKKDAEIRLIMAPGLDVDELSLDLSEVVHHIRSAMDSMAWQLAHSAGGSPANPTKVYFPAAKTPDAWENAKSNLAGVHPELLERIREHQPYTRAAKADGWPTAVVSALSNSDKHRGLLAVQPAVLGISEGEPTNPRADAILTEARFEIRHDFALEDDATISTLEWDEELTEVDLSSITLDLAVGLLVIPRNGASYVIPINELPMAIEYLGNEFEYLLDGNWPANARPVRAAD